MERKRREKEEEGDGAKDNLQAYKLESFFIRLPNLVNEKQERNTKRAQLIFHLLSPKQSKAEQSKAVV